MAKEVKSAVAFLSLGFVGGVVVCATVYLNAKYRDQPLPKSNPWPTAEMVQHERTRLAFEQMVRNIDARARGELPEILPYPGYVEQDDQTPVVEFGGKQIVAEYWSPLMRRDLEPYREDEIIRRWQARDGTVFKIVPKGELP